MDGVRCRIPHAFVYVDDVLIASTLPTEHIHDLTTVFDTLEANGMITNKAKCIFGMDSLILKGRPLTPQRTAFHPSKDGISPLKGRHLTPQRTASHPSKDGISPLKGRHLTPKGQHLTPS